MYTGVTADTPDHLLLDAGAFYKNYVLETGIGTLLGATRGGGEFKAAPETRPIEVDGAKGPVKGMRSLDGWEITLTANLLEITPAALSVALTTGAIDTTTNEDYDIITASNTIAVSNYIDNITWVGRLSGSNKPVVIQIFNALHTDGITLGVEDKSESVLPVTFTAHFKPEDLDTPPFAIYYPKIA